MKSWAKVKHSRFLVDTNFECVSGLTWPPIIVSILSAMTSLDWREKLMPSVPIEIPSLTPIVLKRNPVRPASVTPVEQYISSQSHKFIWQSKWCLLTEVKVIPCFTSPERSIRCMLQGFPSNHTEQMPTWGNAIVSGVNPVAYNIAWEAPWLGGSVMMREYLFKISFSPSACMTIWLLWPMEDCLLKLNENALLQQTIPTTRQKLEEIIVWSGRWLHELVGVVAEIDYSVR